MELEKAKVIADEVIKRLSPYCQRIEVAGSGLTIDIAQEEGRQCLAYDIEPSRPDMLTG